MASEPSDASNDLLLLERRRWDNNRKVYTRKNKGQRNTTNAAASTTTTAQPTTDPGSDEASNCNKTINDVSSSKAPEADTQALVVEDGKSSQPEEQPKASPVEEPGTELQPEECIRLGKQGDACSGGTSGPSSKELLVCEDEAVAPCLDSSRLAQEEGGSLEDTVRPSSNALVPESNEVQPTVLGSEVGASHGETVGPSRIDVLPESSDVVTQAEEVQLGQEAASHAETTGPSCNDVLPASGGAVLSLEDDFQSGRDENSTHGETELPNSNDLLLESGEAMALREDGDRLGLEVGASYGETVRLSSDHMTPENREVVPPQPSGNEAVEANGMVRQEQLELQPVPSVITRVEDRVRINVSGAKLRDEIKGVKRKLESELDLVRSLFKKLEAKELQVTAYNSNVSSGVISNVDVIPNNVNNTVSSYGSDVGNLGGFTQPQYAGSDVVERSLTRVNSELGSVGNNPAKLFSRSLSVSVVENNHGVGEFVEREKRTPKANQYYRNSEFLLWKDKLPSESNKKLKPNGAGRKHGGEGERGFGSAKNRERVFRSCNNLLQRLMKHNFGWVFNEPVDAKKLGLHDYHDIIKHPMDLGTIKNRLSQNHYKSPREFAEDVRLVFHNAMTYNPKGQDVHVMAEQLLNIFEEKWMVIETEYNPDWRYQMYQDAGLPTPTSRKGPATQFYTSVRAPAPAYSPVTPIPQLRTLDRLEPLTIPVDPKLKLYNTHVGRTPAPKKPKARDPNKRDMTYDEKQKLSTNLQGLPSEKLDAIVQIIKKRNSALNQHDDEIEVDIDSVDAETLWELDRFVTNYKKSLSKNKRKAELALQNRPEAVQTVALTNTVPAAEDVQKEIRIGNENAPPIQVEKHGVNGSRSSSSSSSSSDSGSSSSDSDSDSSSASGTDAGHSPRT